MVEEINNPVEKGIVLLLEDNEDILELNRKMLQDLGVFVITALTIETARRRVKYVIPDVAVLDIMLPDGSGFDFLKELRKAGIDVPALFLTAKAERTDIIAGLTAGGNDYITKPYDIDEFCMRVMGFLRLTKRTVQIDRPLFSPSVLDDREVSIAYFAAKGFSNGDISKKIYLSESRIKTVLSEIYGKLGISDKENKRKLLKEMLF